MLQSKIKSLMFCAVILCGLWLVNCKTTPTPGQSSARAPQTQKPAENSPSTSSDSASSAQPAAPEKTQTDQKETGQNLAEDRAATPSAARSRLEKARDDLRLSQATEKRIASELEQLKRSETASADDIRNYETYLQRVQAMVAENRKTVAKMEAAYAQDSPVKEASETSAPSEPEKLSDPAIPEENAPDQVAELDRQLSASLSEFDAVLLKKMEAIETESAAKMHDLAQQAAEAAKRLKEKGEESNTDPSETSDEGSKPGERNEKDQTAEEGNKGQAEENKDASDKQPSPQTQQGQGDDTVAAGERSTGGGPGPQQDPESRYSKEDDDIVARQLREAAEKETDPELKAKLWKEYEAYRKNTQP